MGKVPYLVFTGHLFYMIKKPSEVSNPFHVEAMQPAE